MNVSGSRRGAVSLASNGRHNIVIRGQTNAKPDVLGVRASREPYVNGSASPAIRRYVENDVIDDVEDDDDDSILDDVSYRGFNGDDDNLLDLEGDRRNSSQPSSHPSHQPRYPQQGNQSLSAPPIPPRLYIAPSATLPVAMATHSNNSNNNNNRSGTGGGSGRFMSAEDYFFNDDRHSSLSDDNNDNKNNNNNHNDDNINGARPSATGGAGRQKQTSSQGFDPPRTMSGLIPLSSSAAILDQGQGQDSRSTQREDRFERPPLSISRIASSSSMLPPDSSVRRHVADGSAVIGGIGANGDIYSSIRHKRSVYDS